MPTYKVDEGFREYDRVIINDDTGELIYGVKKKRGGLCHLVRLYDGRILSRKVPEKDLIFAAGLADDFLAAERKMKQLRTSLQYGYIFHIARD